MKYLPLKDPEHIRLERAFKAYLEALGYAPSTSYALPLHAREFMHYLEERESSIATAGEGGAEEYLAHLARRPNRRRGGGLSEAYLAKHRQALVLLSRHLRKSGKDSFELPATGGKRASAEGFSPTVLTREEVRALYKAADSMAHPYGLRDRALLSACYGCGLRRSETVALDCSDVLLRKRLLYVRHGKNYAERYVPMAAGVQADLADYLRRARPALLRRDKDGTGDVHRQAAFFISQRGTRPRAMTLGLRLAKLVDYAGLADRHEAITLHTLRHSIATHLLQGDGSSPVGMPLEEIRRFLGHKSLESTQIYTHLAEEHRRAEELK